jgi:hypothetical protein
MDYPTDWIDEVRSQRWRRWNRRIFQSVVTTRAVGLRTRSACGRGDLYAELQTELFVYGSLANAKIRGYDRARRRRFLAGERKGIRTLVERIRNCGDRVWWTIRRDGSGIDLLVAGRAWSPTEAAVRPAARDQGKPRRP